MNLEKKNYDFFKDTASYIEKKSYSHSKIFESESSKS